ncbi:MAG: C4-dicarboxylate ABC transporter substrate-binding protein, partial [Desulfuromonas sp.]
TTPPDQANKAASPAAKEDPLASWKPAFDPSGAEYVYTLSNVDHPAIAGIAVGYHIRDAVWERSGGRLFVDFRPLAQLGGEKDVINKLKLGAVQGMLCSSVAAVNIADRLGMVNLPFVVDSYEKLEAFRSNKKLFDAYGATALESGIKVVDFTGYGQYGWATTTPVQSFADAQKVNFRIAQAPVNADIYKAWGLKFTVMPWPDVPQALQTGVIDGLDHTPIVCSITKKFDVAKYFTRLDYTQGLYIHLMNKGWFDKLPNDLQSILMEVIAEESAKARALTHIQQDEQIAAASAKGIRFYELPAADRAELERLAEPVYQKWGEKIGRDFLSQVRDTL